jgi:hypothetical protein
MTSEILVLVRRKHEAGLNLLIGDNPPNLDN